MSNHLAIATVTTTLQRLLQQSVQVSVDGASVTTSRPDGSGGVPDTGVNLYLYHLKRNGAFSNGDHPGRQRRGELGKQNQLSIDLYYLISFYGNDADMEPHRLLGSTLELLADQRTLETSLIRDTINDPSFPILEQSDLAEQVEQIRLEFMPISTDELSKVWSVFLQTPYALSVVYKVTVLVLSGILPGQRALPVRNRRLGITPISKQPIIESIRAGNSPYEPILATSTLHLRGQLLQAKSVTVRIGSVEVVPQTVSDTTVIVSLSQIAANELKAGVQGAQIIHHPFSQPSTSDRVMAVMGGRNGQHMRRQPSGSSSRSHSGSSSGAGEAMAPSSSSSMSSQRPAQASPLRKTVESNVMPFVLRPSIQTVAVTDLEGIDDDPRVGNLHITTDVLLRQGQRVIVSLNSRSLTHPDDYVFDPLDVQQDTQTVVIPIQNVQPGDYLVRIQVDGAESVLQVDQNPRSATFEQYIGPAVAIA